MSRLIRSIRRPARARRREAMSGGWHFSPVPAGSDGAARVRAAALEEARRVTHPLDLDIGKVYNGHHLIVRSISLTDQDLLLDTAYAPEVPEDADYGLWPNMTYHADVSPPSWGTIWTDGERYDRPVPEARYAWFDFYPRDYVWWDPENTARDDQENRVARLVFDLKTGQAQVQP